MTIRERIQRTLAFDIKGLDRLPRMEWAPWWNETIERWRTEGLDPALTYMQAAQSLGIDRVEHLWISPRAGDIPAVATGAPRVNSLAEYRELSRNYLYTDRKIASFVEKARQLKPLHDAGELAVLLTLEGYFWFPRNILGIENHLLAFYDEPEFMHEINRDCAAYNRRVLDALCEVLTPDYMTFAEDMSYNIGPMLSKGCFDEFIAPYYRELIPELKRRGIRVFVDSDGKIDDLVPWLIECGVEGLLPLERQSDVDIAALRRKYPRFLLGGGFDKRVIHLGEAAIRAEYDRIFPVMCQGGYLQSCDHQTPPDVSLEQYRLYRRIMDEYGRRAVQEAK